MTVEVIEQSLDKAAVRYDRDGDQHYDVISAFIKSIRGSDVDAALHYLARMLVAGEDPRFIARRLMILASEDIGMADPTALQTAVAAAQTVAADRHARGPADARARHRAPGHRAEVQRGDHRAGRGDGRHQGRQGRAGARRICATGTTRVRRSWATPRATGTPTTTPMALCRNSIRPTSWSASTTTEPTSHGVEREIAGTARQAARHHSPPTLTRLYRCGPRIR